MNNKETETKSKTTRTAKSTAAKPKTAETTAAKTTKLTDKKMREFMENSISIIANREHVSIPVSSIFYVIITKRNAEFHVAGGKVYSARIALEEIEEKLGDAFIRNFRNSIVSALAIHEVTDRIELINGEFLDFPKRKKREIIEQLMEKQQKILNCFSSSDAPQTTDEYNTHYRGFENMPFAFTDIEMVFNKELHTIDWVFRYGNPALAKLEKVPLDKLIGNNFGSIFSNMDPKWLKSYERAAFYGETLEIIDYSPEIDATLKVICFPTFKGHCGCILFNVSDIKFTRNSNDAEKALLLYLGIANGNN